MAGGKTIARKKRLGPAGISTGGHEPGLIVLYSSELEEGIRKWCIVGEERWRTFGANIWYIVGEDYWYMVGANAWYIIAEDYWYIVVRGVTAKLATRKTPSSAVISHAWMCRI